MTKPTLRRRLSDERGSTDPSVLGFLVIIAVIAVLIGGWFTLFAGKTDTATNEVCVAYSGGWFEDKEFKDIIQPGRTKASIGIGSDCYPYRTDQRSYRGAQGYNAETAGRDGNPDAPEVIVTGAPSEEDTSSTVELMVEYQLYFKINRDPEVLRAFHENLGVKTKAWTEDGWRDLLTDYFRPQIERSLEAAALEFAWDDLYSNEETRRAYQARTVELLKAAVNEVIGGDYFCSPAYDGGEDSECGNFTFTVSKPSITSQALLDSIVAGETAQREADNQRVRNEEARTALEVDEELVALYGPEGALLYKAIESGKVTSFIIAPDGTIQPSVPVQPGG